MAENVSELPGNWTSEWENCMALFYKEELDETFSVYVVNTESLKAYHVVDFPYLQHFDEFGCVYSRGKLYLVSDVDRNGVYVCDLSLAPYVWKHGPPMNSAKHYAHLVAYNGMIFALGSPDKSYYNCKDVLKSFEVWDTNNNNPSWVVLPEPPLFNYNPDNGPGAYRVISHTVLNDLLYFVFDFVEEPTLTLSCSYSPSRSPLCYSKVEHFDPNLKQWVRPYTPSFIDDDGGNEFDPCNDDDKDADDMLHMFLQFSALKHEPQDRVLEFCKGDDSLRMFMLDPLGTQFPLPPCFYTYDLSTFDSKSILIALRESQVSSSGFCEWFQAFVRPYLSSVTGLGRLMQTLRYRRPRGHNCFVVPSTYEDGCWNFCVVAFIQMNNSLYATMAKFRLEMVPNKGFQARDLELRIETLKGISTTVGYFSRISS